MVQKGIYLVPTLYHYQLDGERDMKEYAGHSVADVSETSFRRALAAGVKAAFGSGVGPFPADQGIRIPSEVWHNSAAGESGLQL
jgi:hypothetical protein